MTETKDTCAPVDKMSTKSKHDKRASDNLLSRISAKLCDLDAGNAVLCASVEAAKDCGDEQAAGIEWIALHTRDQIWELQDMVAKVPSRKPVKKRNNRAKPKTGLAAS